MNGRPLDYRHQIPKLDSRLRELDQARPGGRTLRRLALAAAATAAGRRDPRLAALTAALDAGTLAEDLREVLLQTYLFAGYPRAINALTDLAALARVPGSAVNPDADLGQDREWRVRGEALCRQVYGDTYERLLAVMGRISPELGRWMIVEGYGKVLSRPRLDARTREVTAVASLTVLHVPPQLRAHVQGARRVGATEVEISEAIALAGVIEPSALAEAERIRSETLAS